jgi:chromosome segregation ATPase
MSTFGTKNVELNLPEDIESRLAQVQENISLIEAKIISTTNQVEAKKIELDILNSKVAEANADYTNKVNAGEKITSELRERELKISQKESALDVYANALKEKEEKINKYLNIFENMKSIVGK